MDVVWSDRASEDFLAVIGYVEQFDQAAAVRIAIRLRQTAARLAQYPRLGRPIGRGMRQLSTVYPYQIRYRVRPDHVEIIAVRHGARRD